MRRGADVPCCFSRYLSGAGALHLPQSGEMFRSRLEISRKRNYYFRQIEPRSQDEYKEDKCNAPAGKCAD